MDINNIGKRMLKVRQDMGLSQRKFAEFANLSYSYLGAIEAGKRTPSFRCIVSVMDATNVSSDWLLTGKGSVYLHTKNERHGAGAVSDDRARYGNNEIAVNNSNTFHNNVEVPTDLKKDWENLNNKQKNELIERVKEMKEYNTMRRIIDNLSSGLKIL
jgi:transcriptional regulator with XRE-family HTH domain